MKVAEENGCRWACHNEDDEDEKEKSKHVVHLVRPVEHTINQGIH